MSVQQFLAVVVIAWVIYFIFYKLSEKHWCLLVDHNYGYSIEFPANRIARSYGKLGSHNLVDMKARFTPRTLEFLITSSVSIFWTEETKDTIELMRDWGEMQLPDNWISTSELEPVAVGQANYEAWTTTFRRNSLQSRHYYIPRENGSFLIEFTQLENQSHLRPIETHMLESFLINDAFITDRSSSFERRTVDCIR